MRSSQPMGSSHPMVYVQPAEVWPSSADCRQVPRASRDRARASRPSSSPDRARAPEHAAAALLAAAPSLLRARSSQPRHSSCPGSAARTLRSSPAISMRSPEKMGAAIGSGRSRAVRSMQRSRLAWERGRSESWQEIPNDQAWDLVVTSGMSGGRPSASPEQV